VVTLVEPSRARLRLSREHRIRRPDKALTDSHEKEPESAPDDGKQPVVVGTGTRSGSSPTRGALKLGLSILHQAI
jgi:hypothetical protein